MTLTDEQLIEALKARGHDEAAAAVAANADVEPEATPQQSLHRTIRSTLTSPPKQEQHQAVADLFTGKNKLTDQNDNEEKDT